jgi:hypothetical protein
MSKNDNNGISSPVLLTCETCGRMFVKHEFTRRAPHLENLANQYDDLIFKCTRCGTERKYGICYPAGDPVPEVRGERAITAVRVRSCAIPHPSVDRGE